MIPAWSAEGESRGCSAFMCSGTPAATCLSGSGSAEGPVRAEAFRGGSGVMLETGPLVEG